MTEAYPLQPHRIGSTSEHQEGATAAGPVVSSPPTDSAALLAALRPDRIDGLYLHVPFCFHKCHYCDFYSIVDDADRQAAFTDRLIAEAHALASTYAAQAGPESAKVRVLVGIPPRVRPSTIFVGGGTPTLLRVDLWRRLLVALHDAFDLSALAEFTVEANPETVTAELLATLVAGGVNRISIGAQSFNPQHLKTLERWHDPANVARSVDLVRSAGIDNFNLDLIFAVPGQSLTDWASDLDRALSLHPSHLSCYGLTYEPNTPLTRKLQLGRIDRTDESLEAAMYEYTIDTLTAAGFDHYEVSNFARRFISPPSKGGAGGGTSESIAPPVHSIADAIPPLPQPRPSGAGGESHRCLHNLGYWLNRNWLALGPSASGHLDGHRWKNTPHLGRYLASIGGCPAVDIEHLAPDASQGERLMLMLRLLDGINLETLDPPLTSDRRAAIDQHLAAGHLEHHAARLRLTRRGLMIADTVLADLL